MKKLFKFSSKIMLPTMCLIAVLTTSKSSCMLQGRSNYTPKQSQHCCSIENPRRLHLPDGPIIEKIERSNNVITPLDEVLYENEKYLRMEYDTSFELVKNIAIKENAMPGLCLATIYKLEKLAESLDAIKSGQDEVIGEIEDLIICLNVFAEIIENEAKKFLRNINIHKLTDHEAELSLAEFKIQFIKNTFNNFQ